jgi:hypothetical protein
MDGYISKSDRAQELIENSGGIYLSSQADWKTTGNANVVYSKGLTWQGSPDGCFGTLHTC